MAYFDEYDLKYELLKFMWSTLNRYENNAVQLLLFQHLKYNFSNNFPNLPIIQTKVQVTFLYNIFVPSTSNFQNAFKLAFLKQRVGKALPKTYNPLHTEVPSL